MKDITDCSDVRQRNACIHCGHTVTASETTRDHIPTKAFLERPYPPRLPVVTICRTCNNSYSADELWMCMFIDAVIAGTCDPVEMHDPVARRRFDAYPSLRDRIVNSTLYRDEAVGFRLKPDQDAVARVVTKNARGHVIYELGEALLEPPAAVHAVPLQLLEPSARHSFETMPDEIVSTWPEVGSRMMTRLATGADMGPHGWITVQGGRYRYHVSWGGGVRVRSVIRDYLATEVLWTAG